MIKRPESSQRRRRWWKLPLVWIEPFRGYVAASMLADAFDPVRSATAAERILPLIVTFMLLWITVWLQTGGRIEEGETVSPSAFLGGMMLGLMPPVVAISAIILGVSTAVAMNSFTPAYIVASLTTAGIGYLFLGRTPWLAVYTVVVASPLLINWLRRTTLVMPIRS